MTRARRRRAVLAGAALATGVVLAVLGPGLAGASRAEDGRVTVVLTARHSRFTPASVEVPAGTSVRFVVHNLDPIDHELIVGGPEVHARHERDREAHHHGDVAGEVSVRAGGEASTTWESPAGGGTFAFACHLPGHLAYGMTGVVTVTATATTRT